MPRFELTPFDEPEKKIIDIYLEKIKQVLGTSVDLEFYSDKSSEKVWLCGSYRLLSGDNHISIADFSLTQLPGCCGILVSHSSCIGSEFRKKGLGNLLHELRIELAKLNGYTILLCTDVVGNVHQKKILDKFGWESIFQFRNKRTNNWVEISVKDLT